MRTALHSPRNGRGYRVGSGVDVNSPTHACKKSARRCVRHAATGLRAAALKSAQLALERFAIDDAAGLTLILLGGFAHDFPLAPVPEARRIRRIHDSNIRDSRVLRKDYFVGANPNPAKELKAKQ